MRKVALDLGAKKTTYCEVADGQVVQRTTVSQVESLKALLGPDQPAATVAIEACREAWYVHDLVSSWGNQVLLIDTALCWFKQAGRSHARQVPMIRCGSGTKQPQSDAANASPWLRLPENSRECCVRSGETTLFMTRMRIVSARRVAFVPTLNTFNFEQMPSRRQRASGFAPRSSGRQLNRTDQPAQQR